MIPVLPGDGIGPAVTREAVRVLQALGRPTREYEFGHGSWLATGRALPDDTLAAVRSARVALVGAATSPPEGCASPILELRRALGLDLLVRPAADATVVGHAFEGLYGEPEDPGPPVVARWVVTEAGADRLVREAFARARRRVTLVDKPTVLRGAARLFRVAAERHARPGIAFELVNADAFLAAFVRDRSGWDILAATSFLSDLLSDLTAAFDHGVGGAPSASLGPDCAVFEPVHGTAPHRVADVPQRADPTGAILAAAMLLDHVGDGAAADRVRRAVAEARGVTNPGRTPTVEVGDAVLRRLG